MISSSIDNLCSRFLKRVEVMSRFTADEVYLLEIRKYGPETRLRHTTVHLKLALAWWEVMADWVPEGEVAGAARPRMEAGAAFGDRSSAQV